MGAIASFDVLALGQSVELFTIAGERVIATGVSGAPPTPAQNTTSLVNSGPITPGAGAPILFGPITLTVKRSGIFVVSAAAQAQLTVGTTGHRIGFQIVGGGLSGSIYSPNVPTVTDEAGSIWADFSDTVIDVSGQPLGGTVSYRLGISPVTTPGTSISLPTANLASLYAYEL